MNSADEFSSRIEEAIKHPKNLGELDGADAVGTVGSEDCGDMRNSDRGRQRRDGADLRQDG